MSISDKIAGTGNLKGVIFRFISIKLKFIGIFLFDKIGFNGQLEFFGLQWNGLR